MKATPRDVLLLANAGYKGMGWKVKPDGRVINREGRHFEVSNPNDLGNVQIALSRQGWQFLPIQKNGEAWLQALHHGKVIHEAKTILELLLIAVRL